jgi:outer membrane protein assembly factor BamB
MSNPHHYLQIVLFVFACFVGPVDAAQDYTTDSSPSSAQSAAQTLSRSKSSWKFFRGDHYDGVSRESGLANSWDAKGPPVLWSIELGGGYSGFVGADDRVFTQYQSLTGQFVVCLDARTGETIWKYRYGWPYKPASLYPGPRSTPTICGDRLFFTTPAGEAGCLDQKTGLVLWTVDLVDKFDAPPVEFGYACSPVIVDDKLVLPVGGNGAAMVALNPINGETIWKSGDYKISYCSAYPIKFEDRDLVVGYFKNELCLFELETGQEVGSLQISEDYDEHSAWPIYRAPFLWISGPFRAGCQLLQLVTDEEERIRLKTVYKKDIMSNDVASCVLVGDSIIGFDLRDVQSKVHRPSRGKFCSIDFMTGNLNWENGSLGRRSTSASQAQSGSSASRVIDGSTISSQNQAAESDIGHASVVFADDKLIMLNDTGQLIIGRVARGASAQHQNSNKYQELGRWTILGGEIVWTAPTVFNRCVFARNQTSAVCVYLGDISDVDELGLKSKTVEFITDIPQRKFLNLAPIILGTEPKFAMTAPKPKWLINWFLVSIALGWIVAPLFAVVTGWVLKQVSIRWVFLLLGACFGIFGTTIAGRYFNVFYFSWPIALAFAFESLVMQMKTSDENIKTRPVLARFVLLTFLGVCVFYFWLCRRLSLAFEWSFLMGFPAALPLLWIVKRNVDKASSFSITQWLGSAAAFTAFYWTGAGIMIWCYQI